MPQVTIVRRMETTTPRSSPRGPDAAGESGAWGASARGTSEISLRQKRQVFARAAISSAQKGHFRTTVEEQNLQTLESSGISSRQKGHFFIADPSMTLRCGRSEEHTSELQSQS